MKILRILTLSATLMAGFALTAVAQNTTLPSSKAETDALISARQQITDVPTIYIWMYDAELNAKQTKPKEYQGGTTDHGDNYFMIRTTSDAAGTYSLKISENLLAANPDMDANAVILANYGKNEAKSDQYRLARIKVVDGAGTMKARDELTTIRGRGNSTWWTDKKAFRLKFPYKTKLLADADGNNEYADAKNWTLLANVADKSLLRNALTREVSLNLENKTGVKALPFHPAYKFIDLVVNDIYVGTYQVSDHVQIGPDRINIDENNGWFLEGVGDTKFLEDNYVTINGYNVNVKNPEEDFYTDETKANIESYLSNLASLYSSDCSEATGFFKYADMQSLAAYFIVNEITGNFDGMIQNYMYRDINDGDKLKFGPMWDYDIAYGNYGDNEGKLTNGFIFQNGKNSDWATPGIMIKNVLANSPQFAILVNEWWEKVYDNGNLATYLKGKVDEIASTMAHSRQLNYTPVAQGGAGWNLGTDDLGWGLKTYSNYESAIQDIKDFIDAHIAFLNTEIRKLIPVAEDYTINATEWNNSNTPFYGKSGKLLNVTITNRTFTSGVWNTICLPFSLTMDQLKEKFGNDVQLVEYTDYTDGKMIFSPATELVAGTPYMLKFTGSNVANPTFNDVCISVQQASSTVVDSNPDISFTGNFFIYDGAKNGSVMTYDNSTDTFIPYTTYDPLPGMSASVGCSIGTAALAWSINEGSDTPPTLPGDANDDGMVSVTDVTYMVDYILGNATDKFNLKNADVNEDKKIDVTDVTRIVDIILSNH